MHLYKDEQQNERLLKTKIVATVGAKRGNPRRSGKAWEDVIYDPKDTLIEGVVEYDKLLRWLIHAGVDVIRLNMSFAIDQKPYGSMAATVLDWLNEHKDDFGKHIAVLGDLPGPKIRLGLIKPLNVVREQELWLNFGSKICSSKGRKCANVLINNRSFEEGKVEVEGYDNISEYIRNAVKDVIFYVGDGDVILKAESVEDEGIVKCSVLKEGTITQKQGLTIKRAKLAVPIFQQQDQRALNLLLEKGGDVLAFIAVSFVREKEDILVVKNFIDRALEKRRLILKEKAKRPAPAIIAKIETLDAWENIDEILDVADGVMVARGDLGLQLDPQDVPAIQKELIRKCNLRGKPIITATQMLDSMEEHLEPTRAETTDVFNAILDGTDAVMLSGETSKGMYPTQAVQMMVKIAEQAEAYYFEKPHRRSFQDVLEGSGSLIKENTGRIEKAVVRANTSIGNLLQSPPKTKTANEEWERKRRRYEWERDLYVEKLAKSMKQETTDRISQSTCVLSEGGDYKAVIAPTKSGRTPRMISRFRPKVPIIGVTHDIINARKLLLSFGVYPLCIGAGQRSIDKIFEAATQEAKKESYINWLHNFYLLRVGDMVISTGGVPLFTPGTTNLIQIREV